MKSEGEVALNTERVRQLTVRGAEKYRQEQFRGFLGRHLCCIQDTGRSESLAWFWLCS